MTHEYSMIGDCQDVTGLSHEQFDQRLAFLQGTLVSLGQSLQGMLEAHPPAGDWEAVSHSVAAIDGVLLTSVLVRRQSS